MSYLVIVGPILSGKTYLAKAYSTTIKELDPEPVVNTDNYEVWRYKDVSSDLDDKLRKKKNLLSVLDLLTTANIKYVVVMLPPR